jgi:von Hippel-Lindau disease tumor supressor
MKTLFPRYPIMPWIRPVLFAAVMGLGLSLPPRAAALDEEQLREIRSGHEGVDTKLTFVNHSGQAVKIWWIDWEGNRKVYKVLKNGQSYEQETWTLHAWLVTDARDVSWEVYYPKPAPSTVEIETPSPD